MTYEQAEAARAEAPVALARFHARVAKALWCFEFNREPSLDDAELPFGTWEEFDEFFGALPVGLEWHSLIARADEEYAAAAAAAPEGSAARGTLHLERASVADMAGGDPEECYAAAERVFAALGDREKLGDVAMGRAHGARYRSYDAKECLRQLRLARDHYDAAGTARGSALAALRTAENSPFSMDLWGEASELYHRLGDKPTAANVLAEAVRVCKEAGNAGMEEAAFAVCLMYIEGNFKGEDLAKNYDAAAAFYAGRGRAEKAEEYRAKAAALRA